MKERFVLEYDNATNGEEWLPVNIDNKSNNNGNKNNQDNVIEMKEKAPSKYLLSILQQPRI